MLYIIRREGTDQFKVGYSGAGVDDRIRQLQTATPDKLVKWGEYFGSKRDEAYLHRKLHGYHIHRGGGTEWFEVDEETLQKVLDAAVRDHRIHPYWQSHISSQETTPPTPEKDRPLTSKDWLGVAVGWPIMVLIIMAIFGNPSDTWLYVAGGPSVFCLVKALLYYIGGMTRGQEEQKQEGVTGTR
jgi:hypothetical protein